MKRKTAGDMILNKPRNSGIMKRNQAVRIQPRADKTKKERNE